jgi:SAM-dependent methyltransferase
VNDGEGAAPTEPGMGYVPAAGKGGFTQFYDLALATTMRERRWRGALVEMTSNRLPVGGTVVDVGAGTGTFAIALKKHRPDSTVIAVDGDREILAIARRKQGAERVDWRVGLAGQLDLGTPADVVTMSLLLHHLRADSKMEALGEAARLLRPAGFLVVADWGPPSTLPTRIGFLALRMLDGFANTDDHARGRLPGLIAMAGFDAPATRLRLGTVWGRLELLEARVRER